jgi:hypothetical protein
MDALRRQKLLKVNPKLMALMANWWDSTMALPDKIDTPGMTKAQYVIFSVAVWDIIEPGLSPEEAIESAERDWMHDMEHHPDGHFTFDQFYHLMFDLCDSQVKQQATLHFVHVVFVCS